MPDDPGFIWPPRRSDATPAPFAAARPDPGNEPAPPPAGETARFLPMSPIRDLLRSIEEVWLGLDTRPLEERMAAEGWSPDRPEAYCSRCGSSVGRYEADRTGCPACRDRRLPWERLVRLGEYDGLLKDVVHEIKFTRWRRLGDQVGRVLGRSISDALTEAGLNPARTAVVPVPASFRRRMSRGIDHAVVIARGVSAQTGLPVMSLLTRRHRPSQLSVPASDRASNVAGSILPRGRRDLTGWNLIVLDDVTTTRATLMAACRGVLGCHRAAQNGVSRPPPRLWTAVVAVTQSEPRARPRRAAKG